jgi:type IV pilus assembly protein PilB
MAEMDIAEKRAPQDGRISAIIESKPFDFRVSTLPAVFGEKIVMRVPRQVEHLGRACTSWACCPTPTRCSSP